MGSRCEGLNECGGEGDGVVSNGSLEMKILQASTERREFWEGQGQVWMMKGLDESSEPLFVNDDIIKPELPVLGSSGVEDKIRLRREWPKNFRDTGI